MNPSLFRILIKSPKFTKIKPICVQLNNYWSRKMLQTSVALQNRDTPKEYVPHPADDPNTFGTLTESGQVDHTKFEIDLKDLQDEERSQYKPVKESLNTKQYADIIKGFIQQHKIKEAIDVLEVRMLQEDRTKPESYIYSLLIGACGRVGYTKKAFMLFNDMKKRGLRVHPGAYTALFNACANSPWLEDGLSRATKLRATLLSQRYEPNDTNYNAMIKAFGRLQDFETAFGLVDEMISKRIALTTDSINFLLQACISNRSEGFRHALLVWRKLIDRGLSPNLFSFNLMLRIVRDCEIGDTQTCFNVIEDIVNIHQKKNPNLLIEGAMPANDEKNTEELTRTDNTESTNALIQTSNETDLESKVHPNLLSTVLHMGAIISVNAITKPEHRLMLVGGCPGFLNEMRVHKVTPNIKTFTQMLDSLPATNTAENNLLIEMKKFKIRPDIDFFNMLIRKRFKRFDYIGGKDVLRMIDQANLQPNVMTYGILAHGCKTFEEAEALIKIIDIRGYRSNIEIVGAMMQQACYRNDFSYILKLMEIVLQQEIEPNKKFLDHLTTFQKKCSKWISEMTNKKFTDKDYFKNNFKTFNLRFKTWRTEIKTNSSEDHPWQQFRVENPNSINYKDPVSHFKPRYTSKFRVKTSTKVRY